MTIPPITAEIRYYICQLYAEGLTNPEDLYFSLKGTVSIAQIQTIIDHLTTLHLPERDSIPFPPYPTNKTSHIPRMRLSGHKVAPHPGADGQFGGMANDNTGRHPADFDD